jgi:hypothetical protein
MRAILGLGGLLVVMAIVAILMKQNLSTTRTTAVPASVEGVNVPKLDTSKNVHEQSQQIQKQVQDDLNKALQQGNERLESLDK